MSEASSGALSGAMSGASTGAMLGPWGAAIGGAVGGAAGFLGGKRAGKRKKKLKRKIENQRAITRSIFGKGLSQQEALERQAIQQQLGGFDLAKQAANMQAGGAKRAALDREQQLAGQVNQSMTNSGMGGTTRNALAQRGVSSGTTREMSNIDEGLAQYFGQLAMGRAGVEAGGTRSLADLAGQRSNFDIEDAQFWMPTDMSRLGGMDTKQQQMEGPGYAGIDFSQLASIFGSLKK